MFRTNTNDNVVSTSDMNEFEIDSVQSKGRFGHDHPTNGRGEGDGDDDDDDVKAAAKIMKWEELESSSEEEDFSIGEEEDQSFYVSISLLSSSKPDSPKTSISGPNQANFLSSSTNFTNHSADSADSVLIEIYRDCGGDYKNSKLQADTTNGIHELQAIENLVSRTLLYWPTFTPTNQNNDEKESEEAQQQQPIAPNRNTNSKTPMKDVSTFLAGVQSTLKGVMKGKDTSGRNKDGLISATMYRRGESSIAESEGQQADIDDAMEVLNRMSLNVYFDDYDAKASASASLQNTMGEKPSNTILEGSSPESDDDNRIGDLYFCCLSKHGYLHSFALTELLCENTNTTKKVEGNTTGPKQGDFEEIFSQDFERFLFGQSLHNRVKKTILPLSQPRKSLKLSMFRSGLQGNDKDIDASQIQAPVATEGLQFLDVYSLDANIEFSTIHNRTFNNIPSLCSMSFDFVIVAGKGTKYTQRQSSNYSPGLKQEELSRENIGDGSSSEITNTLDSISDASNNPSMNETSDLVLQDKIEEDTTPSNNNPVHTNTSSFGDEISPVSSGNNSSKKKDTENVSGGFVTFVSVNHFSEAKTTFLPFSPISISSVVWNDIPVVVVMGKDIKQCVAIRTKSSMNSTFSYPTETINEKKMTKSWRKFSSLPIIVAHHTRSVIDRSHVIIPLPIPISASLSLPSPPILVYSKSTKGIVLRRYTLNSLEEIDYGREGPNISNEMVLTTKHDPEQFVIIPQPTGVESQSENCKILSIGEGQVRNRY